MDETNPNVETQADDTQLMSAAVDTTVEQVTPKQEEALTLSELNTFLGKSFKDKETALKSLKDTASYVGKKREDIVKEVAPSTDVLKELAELKENLFYKDNPDYATHRNLIKKLGNNPAEVVNSPEFKAIFESAKAHDESQKRRTVLESNPRFVQTKDNFTKAKESMAAGNKEEAEGLIARTVIDAIGLGNL